MSEDKDGEKVGWIDTANEIKNLPGVLGSNDGDGDRDNDKR